MSGNNWVYLLCEHIKSIGIQGLEEIPSELQEVRDMLEKTLQTSEQIIRCVPRNLSVPDHWG